MLRLSARRLGWLLARETASSPWRGTCFDTLREVPTMVRANVDVTDVDDIPHVMTRQRNRNRPLAIGLSVLVFVTFAIVTTVVYLNP